MSQSVSPNRPQDKFQFVSLDTGKLTNYGLQTLEQIWNQVGATFGICPCDAVTTTNVIALTPRLNAEGGRDYGDHMEFAFVADATTSGSVTAYVNGIDATKPLATIKVYIDNGATQAGLNDITANRFYKFCYVSALDGGNGGFVVF